MAGDGKGAPLDVWKREENRICADCDAKNPGWASVKLGIFICETCAGIHRNLGTHISFVKSAKLDTWKPEHKETARKIGNAASNAYYEARVPPGAKYTGGADAAGGDKIEVQAAKKLNQWIRDKYEHRKYANPDLDPPHERVARGEELVEISAPKKSKKHKKEEKDAPSGPASHPALLPIECFCEASGSAVCNLATSDLWQRTCTNMII
jgi:stromal membrane-associated protein